MKRSWLGLERWVLPALGVIALFGLWEAAGRLGLMPRTLLPLPSSIPATFVSEVRGGYWLTSVWASLGHYTAGLVIGSCLGIVLGVLVGLSRRAEAAQAWVVRILRPIPGLAWIPFAIVWFGITPAAATFVIGSSVFWINYFAAWSAVQLVDRDLVEVASAFGHGSFRGRLVKVILPAATPGILNGLRTGLGQGWMAVVAAELFGIPGVGGRMMQAASLLATDIVVVCMLTMALLYGVTDIAFIAMRRRLLAWQR